MDEMTQKMTILLCQGGVFIDPLSEENRDHFDEPPLWSSVGSSWKHRLGNGTDTWMYDLATQRIGLLRTGANFVYV